MLLSELSPEGDKTSAGKYVGLVVMLKQAIDIDEVLSEGVD